MQVPERLAIFAWALQAMVLLVDAPLSLIIQAHHMLAGISGLKPMISNLILMQTAMTLTARA